MKKVHITSMGCAKNLVDSEVLTGQLAQRDYAIITEPADADIIIINTCGFIGPAKKESIQAIFEALEIKKNRRDKKVFVTGCLTQRYGEQIRKEIPEIDGVFGTEDYRSILAALGHDSFHPEEMYRMRLTSTPRHYAYLKISEGCNHTCAFCAIPSIRGKHRSRTMEDILAEAEKLARDGVRELILISQDTSYYGKDLTGKQQIVVLLRKLAESGYFRWIRPLYWYPGNFPLDYIGLMNQYDSIIPYLDMPVQHGSDRVLRLMRRAETGESLRNLYKTIRSIRPDITLRSTLIVGHPGETKEDFEALLSFVEEIRFDRLGSFVYSDEEGTFAADLNNKVSASLARKRQQLLMELQQSISREKNQERIGRQVTVLIDDYNASEDTFSGRGMQDTPEIDNEVIISAGGREKELIGTFQEVVIMDASEYELYGRFSAINAKEQVL
jgi:ribosomal protein S12 methylthiotransferase